MVEQLADRDLLPVRNEAGQSLLDAVVQAEFAFGDQLEHDHCGVALRQACDLEVVARPHRRLAGDVAQSRGEANSAISVANEQNGAGCARGDERVDVLLQPGCLGVCGRPRCGHRRCGDHSGRRQARERCSPDRMLRLPARPWGLAFTHTSSVCAPRGFWFWPRRTPLGRTGGPREGLMRRRSVGTPTVVDKLAQRGGEAVGVDQMHEMPVPRPFLEPDVRQT